MAVIGGIAILFMIYGIVHFIIMNNQYNKRDRGNKSKAIIQERKKCLLI